MLLLPSSAYLILRNAVREYLHLIFCGHYDRDTLHHAFGNPISSESGLSSTDRKPTPANANSTRTYCNGRCSFQGIPDIAWISLARKLVVAREQVSQFKSNARFGGMGGCQDIEPKSVQKSRIKTMMHISKVD